MLPIQIDSGRIRSVDLQFNAFKSSSFAAPNTPCYQLGRYASPPVSRFDADVGDVGNAPFLVVQIRGHQPHQVPFRPRFEPNCVAPDLLSVTVYLCVTAEWRDEQVITPAQMSGDLPCGGRVDFEPYGCTHGSSVAQADGGCGQLMDIAPYR